MFEKGILLRQLLGSSSDREISFTEGGDATCKLWTQMQIKHELITLANMSSLRGCEIQWISQDKGSERQSRSLVHSSVIGIEDARMTVVYRERELRWYEDLLRADE